jgi:hypothetical protein
VTKHTGAVHPAAPQQECSIKIIGLKIKPQPFFRLPGVPKDDSGLNPECKI